MSRSHFSIIVTLFVCVLGMLSTPIFAAVDGTGDVEVTIKTASGSCDRFTVIFDTRNIDEMPGIFTLHWTLRSDGVPIKTGSFSTDRWSGERRAELPSGHILTGEYEIEFEGNDSGGGDKEIFTAGTCVPGAPTSETSSGSSPVELPPCKLEDTRLDESCGSAFVVTYDQKLEDGCYISIYSKYGRADSQTVLLFQSTPAEIAAAQAAGGNAIIERADVVNLTETVLYWLPETGEFQVNAGPNAEGKVYVLNFTGCPATNVYTTNSYQKAQ